MRARELPFLLVAMLLHGTLPVAAAIAPWPELNRPVRGSAEQPAEVDIDVELLQPVPEEQRVSRERALAIGPMSPLAREQSGRRIESEPLEATTDPSAQPPEDAPLAPIDPTPGPLEPGPSDYDLPPSAVDMPGGTGLPGSGPLWATLPDALPRDGRNTDPAPTRAPERVVDRKQGEKVVNDAMRAKDRKLGLDLPAAAAIGSIVVSAVRASETPYECRGSFAVSLGPDGKVKNVSLLSYSGGTQSDWDGIRAAVAGALKARTFPMTSRFPKGALVSVTAISRIEKPKAIGVEGSGVGVAGSFDVSAIGQRDSRRVSPSIQVAAVE